MRTTYCLLLSLIMLSVSFSGINFKELTEDHYSYQYSQKSNANVDFAITSLELGNSSFSPRTWSQPDSSTLEFLSKGEAIQIDVTFKQEGIIISPTTADAYLEILHPIGITLKQWSFNMSLIGGESETKSFIWIPETAHSIMSEDGVLSGGITFKVSVDAGVGIEDGSLSNNDFDRQVPVSLWYDDMENGFCDDEGNEGKYCTNLQLGYGRPTWYAAASSDFGLDSNYPTGTWRMDNSSSSSGEWHWTVSGENTNYASNRVDYLYWAWRTTSNADGCYDGVWSDDYTHGLGTGIFDYSLSSLHAPYICRARIQSPDLYSVQIVTDAWGEMADSNDSISLITRTTQDSTHYLNHTESNLSSIEGDWKRLIWDATGLHPNEAFDVAFRFDSNQGISGEGIHIDSFFVFAIERYPEYTLDAQCEYLDNSGDPRIYDPEAEGGVTIQVESADPYPPSVHCSIFNRGYIDTRLWLLSEVSNSSWNYPVRIESNNKIDNYPPVKSNVVKARSYTDVWFNLTVPDGADVQELDWFMDINDGIRQSESKYSIELPLAVVSTYRMTFKQDGLAKNPAASILPENKANVTMNLKNVGNQYSSWNLGGLFEDSRFSSDDISWYEVGGDEISIINMSPNEEVNLNAEISIPTGMDPGTYSLKLQAIPRAPNTFLAESTLFIHVPVYHDLAIAPVKKAMLAPANGEAKSVQVFFFNKGNIDDTFNVSVTSDNWRVLPSLSTESLTMSKNGGQSTLSLLLPMPYGIVNGTYRVIISAISSYNPAFQQSAEFYLTVPKTYLVDVEDRDLTGEIFAAGADARTLKWEIWNTGNADDSYSIDLSHDPDVSANVQGLINGRTPYIPAGSSYNLSVSYSFDFDVDGTRIISLKATSFSSEKSDREWIDNSQRGLEDSVFDEGDAIFNVGTVGWIRAIPSLQSSTAMNDITEPGDDYTIVFNIRSGHPDLNQTIRAEVELENQHTIYSGRVVEEDQDFVLQANESREISVVLEIRETDFNTLMYNIVDFNVTLRLSSEIDVTSKTTSIRLVKPEPIEEGTDVEEAAWKGANYFIIGIGIIAILSILFVSMRIVLKSNSSIEEYSSLDDYSMSIGSWTENQGADLKSLPSADDIANSMFGGSKDIFEQKPDLVSKVDDNEIKDSQEVDSENQSETPPIPETGLPEGWTIEQWSHYGQKWLDSQEGD